MNIEAEKKLKRLLKSYTFEELVDLLKAWYTINFRDLILEVMQTKYAEDVERWINENEKVENVG